MRFIPHQNLEESVEVITKLAAEYGLETEFLGGNPACTPIDVTSNAYKLIENTINETFEKLPVIPYVMTGATDARFYQEICDTCFRFSPIMFGPEVMKGMHGLNEYVDTASLPGAVDFYKALIKNNK